MVEHRTENGLVAAIAELYAVRGMLDHAIKQLEPPPLHAMRELVDQALTTLQRDRRIQRAETLG